MRDGIHPGYQQVLFKDVSSGEFFVTGSTMKSKEKLVHTVGQEYPLIKVDISSTSHPFFTGKQKFVDAAGRVEKFQKKFGGSPFAKKA